MQEILSTAVMIFILFCPALTFSADAVIVVPLGGAVGDATPGDVIKGKTFSSIEGKGLTGTLEHIPCIPQQPCYTYAPETRNVGECRDGKFQINVNDNTCVCIGDSGPATDEFCNAVDDDCDGLTDEDSVCLCDIGEQIFADCEGYGVVDICTGIDLGGSFICCGLPPTLELNLGYCIRGVPNNAKLDAIDYDDDGYSSPEDCNDNDPNVYPGAAESCNGYDDDCDYIIDEGCQ